MPRLAEARSEFPRDDGSALDGRALGEQQLVAGPHARACRSDRARTLPAIIPATTGRVTASVISVCPPHSVMPAFAAEFLQLANNAPNAGRRAAHREEQGRQQPAGRRAGGGDVVGIDQHRILSDRVGGKGDRVGLQDQDLLRGARPRRRCPRRRPGRSGARILEAEFGPRNARRRSLGSLPAGSGAPMRISRVSW